MRHRGRTTLLSFERLWQRLAAEHEELEDGLIEPSNLEVLSWVPGGEEPQFLPVMCVTRRDYDGELVEVRTKMGRRVRTHARTTAGSSATAAAVKPTFKLAERA